jgi:hypothetical protein
MRRAAGLDEPTKEEIEKHIFERWSGVFARLAKAEELLTNSWRDVMKDKRKD